MLDYENAVLLILKCDGAITRVVSKEFRIHIDWHNDSGITPVIIKLFIKKKQMINRKLKGRIKWKFDFKRPSIF